MVQDLMHIIQTKYVMQLFIYIEKGFLLKSMEQILLRRL